MLQDCHPFERRVLKWREVVRCAKHHRPVWIQNIRFEHQWIDGRPVIPIVLGDRVQIGKDRPLIGPLDEHAASVFTKRGLLTLYPAGNVEKAVYRFYPKAIVGVVLFPEIPADAGCDKFCLAFQCNGMAIKADYWKVIQSSVPLADRSLSTRTSVKHRLYRAAHNHNIDPLELKDPKNFSQQRRLRRAKKLVK